MSWSARNVPFNAGEMSRLVAGAMFNQPEEPTLTAVAMKNDTSA